MATIQIEGGCYCGAVRYLANEKPKYQAICFCANCRRAVGAQSVAWVTFTTDRFSFVKGSPARFRTDTEAWRTFCRDCGSSLTYESDDRPGEIDAVTASLDRPEDFPPNRRVFEEERLPWDTFRIETPASTDEPKRD
ncbi:MAG: hypothetical protein A3F84_18945 [Candidatus Handelsmanbacteria bacterium RIFCSPLOWO2_12_FULL_64_10]|uniref:CENP-V/GFA domain-containing protein n=1 Tax=Handelsmanbacteria sp. (strain RIFCSPLOWO2_12_FULL_64_10) TaxID=1817868 RepID=A0A1F6C3Z1_HANXR|nr:MAG: hypothetical protein A3F84_18945 [Candidatus Handelsmanbacteria bacterium RIFCSPLOWO2_12_FULL_64_10]